MVPFLANSADTQQTASLPPSTLFTLRFEEDKNITEEYTFENIKHFEAIKSMAVDLNTSGNTIPIPCKKAVWDFLIILITQSLPKPEDTSHIAYEKSLLALFDETKQKNEDFKNVTFYNLLIAADHLDASHRFKNALAYGYVEKSKTEMQQVQVFTDQRKTVINDLPHELELLIAGWLLYDIVTHHTFNYDENKHSLSYDFKNRLSRAQFPKISLPPARDMLTAVWKQPIKTLNPFSIQYNAHIHRLDITIAPDGSITSHEKILEYPTDRFSEIQKCALSEDGKHLLIVDTKKKIKSNGHETLELEIILFPSREKIELHETPQSFVIHDILFNAKTRCFIIIAQKNWNTFTNNEKQLWIYTINPEESIAKKDVAIFNINPVDSIGHFAALMHWSCIDEGVIGTLRNRDGSVDVILYKPDSGEIYKCQQNNDKEWYYENMKMLNVSLIIMNHLCFPIQSFIPHFAAILQKKINLILSKKNIRVNKDIDLQHLRMNYCDYEKNTIGVEHFFDPKLRNAIQFLNRKKKSGNNHIGIDSFFLHAFYSKENKPNQAPLSIQCTSLLPYISPEIKEIYVATPQKSSPTRWQRMTGYIHDAVSQYRNAILGAGALVGTGLGAWLWYKSKNAGTALSAPQ